MIISASRRTDIPALYSRWFINRIHEGFLLTRNPYNARQIKRVSLLRADVDAFVFWTRNAAPLIRYLSELDALHHNYYFQYTITGYPKLLEKHLPEPDSAIATFIKLSELIGKERVIWRYDPIFLSNVTPLAEQKRLFAKIAQRLAGRADKVVISFADLYAKTERKLAAIKSLTYYDILGREDELQELCLFMAKVAAQYDMKITGCAEAVDLTPFAIAKGKCIDDRLLNRLFDLHCSPAKDPNQRLPCGCIGSVDIGQYNSCWQGCVYCYANDSEKRIKYNQRSHDPQSPFLLGSADGIDKHLLLKTIIAPTLF